MMKTFAVLFLFLHLFSCSLENKKCIKGHNDIRTHMSYIGGTIIITPIVRFVCDEYEKS